MTKIKICILFLAIIFLDGIVLPSLFGLRNSLLSIVFLVVSAFYIRPINYYVVFGFAFSVFLESLRGLDLGSLALPFLLLAAAICLIEKFLDIKYENSDRISVLNTVAISIVSIALVYTLTLFYWHGSFSGSYLNSGIFIILSIETVLVALAQGLIFANRNRTSY